MNKQFILTIGLVLALLGPLSAAPVAAAQAGTGVSPSIVKERFFRPGLDHQHRCPRTWHLRHQLRLMGLAFEGNSVGGIDSLSNVLVSEGTFNISFSDQAQLGAKDIDSRLHYWRSVCNDRREPADPLLGNLI